MPNESPLPPLFPRHIRRPRLTRILDATSAQTILLLAPAGYGKTTLAAEWLQANDLAIWYRATPASADVAAFSVGVAEVVQPIVPGAGERLNQRVRIGDAPEHAARALAELLAEDLGDWPSTAWLVVDDYHLVMESKATEEFVETLLAAAPIRFLATSRKRPSWATARRNLYGKVRELRAENLEMTEVEARELLRMGSTKGVARIIDSAQGWPVLLGLFAISAGTPPIEEALSGDLFSYLAEEVLLQESLEVQGVLLRLSLLPTLAPSLVASAAGPSNLLALQDLARRGLLMLRGAEPALHPLFRTYLRTRVITESPHLVAQVAGPAIEAARRAHLWSEAVDLAQMAGWDQIATDVASEGVGELLLQGRLETIEKWVHAPEIRTHDSPRLGLGHAEVLLRRSEHAQAEALATAIAAELGPDSEDASRAWLIAGRAAYLASSYNRAHDLNAKALATATEQEDRREAAWGAFIAAHGLNWLDATDHLQALERAVLEAPDLTGRVRLATARQLAAAQDGSLAGAWEQWQPLIHQVPAADPLAASCALGNIAWLHCCTANYLLSRTFASDAITLCRRYRLDFAASTCSFLLARANIGLRALRLADQGVRGLHDAIQANHDQYLEAAHRTLVFRLALSRGNPESVLATLESDGLQQLDPHLAGELLALVALAAAAADHPDLAREYATRSREATSEAVVRALTEFAEVIAIDRAAATPLGTRALLDAVRHADSTGSLDALVLSYRSCPSILGPIAQDHRTSPILQRTMASARDHRLATRYGVLRPDDSVTRLSTLTQRETQVYDLVVSGRTNAEIATILSISPSTAKVHVHNILRKVGSRSRHDLERNWRSDS